MAEDKSRIRFVLTHAVRRANFVALEEACAKLLSGSNRQRRHRQLIWCPKQVRRPRVGLPGRRRNLSKGKHRTRNFHQLDGPLVFSEQNGFCGAHGEFERFPCTPRCPAPFRGEERRNRRARGDLKTISTHKRSMQLHRVIRAASSVRCRMRTPAGRTRFHPKRRSM
jgi:hypothetical protein